MRYLLRIQGKLNWVTGGNKPDEEPTDWLVIKERKGGNVTDEAFTKTELEELAKWFFLQGFTVYQIKIPETVSMPPCTDPCPYARGETATGLRYYAYSAGWHNYFNDFLSAFQPHARR